MKIPLQYLLSTSDASLQGFMLKRMNDAANLHKEAKEIEREALDSEVAAGVASWLLENRQAIVENAGAHLEKVEEFRPREVA